MAIVDIRVKTLGNGVSPIATSDFLKDNEDKNVKVKLTNIDPGKEVTDVTDSFGDMLAGLGSNIKKIIKATLDKIKSGLKWLKDAGSATIDWLHETIGKFLIVDMGFMGGALNLKGKTLSQIISECGIFGAGLKMGFGIPTIAFWLYSLMAILLQLLCMGIKGVFGALMKFGSALGIPEAAFGGALSYFVGNKGSSNGVDNLIDISSTDIAGNSHKYVNKPGKSFLEHIKGDIVHTRDPVDKYTKVKSSLDVLAPKWSGGNSLSLSAGGDNSNNLFNGENIVKNDTMISLAHNYNLNIVNKPSLDEEHSNTMVFTKNVALMKVVK